MLDSAGTSERSGGRDPERASPRRGHAALALALGLAIAAGLIELGVRALHLAPALPGEYSRFVPDAILPWKPEPGSVHAGRAASGEFDFHYAHNSLGFRDVEHAFEKPPGTFRIVGIGDSFTYGVGAPLAETYLARLESDLREQRGLNVEVIKLGVPRYWPEPERLVFEHYGLRFEPDLVVVGFLANDFNDTRAGLGSLRVSRGFLMTRSAARLGPGAAWLHRHSHAARIALTALAHSLEPAPEERSVDEVWDEIYTHYTRIVELANAVGAPVVFLHIPQRPPWPAWAPDPPRHVRAFCERAGCRVVDVLPAAMEYPEPERLYFPQDGHCTPEGYALVARVLAEALFEQRLLDPDRQVAQSASRPDRAPQ